MISIKLKLVLKGIFLGLFLWACALGRLNNMDIQVKKSKTPMILEMWSLISWIIPAIGLITSIAGIVISSKRLKKGNCKAQK